jgi:hypothetical protein
MRPRLPQRLAEDTRSRSRPVTLRSSPATNQQIRVRIGVRGEELYSFVCLMLLVPHLQQNKPDQGQDQGCTLLSGNALLMVCSVRLEPKGPASEFRVRVRVQGQGLCSLSGSADGRHADDEALLSESQQQIGVQGQGCSFGAMPWCHV